MIAAAVILLAAAGYITYEVAAVYETLPLPLDKAVQNFFFSLRGPVQDVIISSITHRIERLMGFRFRWLAWAALRFTNH